MVKCAPLAELVCMSSPVPLQPMYLLGLGERCAGCPRWAGMGHLQRTAPEISTQGWDDCCSCAGDQCSGVGQLLFLRSVMQYE